MARGEITGKKLKQSSAQSKRLPGPPRQVDPDAIEATPQRDPKEHDAKKQPRNRGPPTHAFTILEFCDAHRISKARYYELKKQGLTPIEMIVGRKHLISFEAADLWRRQRERVAAA
jgi:hypothetical protein